MGDGLETKAPDPLARSGARSNGRKLRVEDSVPGRERQGRIPAFGRALRDAIRAGNRPRCLGGGVIVTTDWRYASAAHGARLVCPPGEPAKSWALDFLAGLDVLVLVPSDDARHGAALAEAIRDAGAALVVLLVDHEARR